MHRREGSFGDAILLAAKQARRKISYISEVGCGDISVMVVFDGKKVDAMDARSDKAPLIQRDRPHHIVGFYDNTVLVGQLRDDIAGIALALRS